MNHREKVVVVTGIGIVSSYGLGVNKFWEGLMKGQSNQKEITHFDCSNYRSNIAAEVTKEIYQSGALRKACNFPKEDATLLAMIAANEALENAKVDSSFLVAHREEIGCILGTLCSGGREFERYARLFVKDPLTVPFNLPNPHIVNADYQLTHLVQTFGLGGPSTIISTACSSATDAIGYAAEQIALGEARMMLAGGSDILAEIVHAGFNGVLSITRTNAKPFDKNRDGFFIGEGAGILILESMDSAIERGAKIYAQVMGYGLSNTAYHLTATSDDGRGEALSMERALEDSNLLPSHIDYINAHGTATIHNDITEAKAISNVFGIGAQAIKVNTIKPLIGHCMGAAGALEAIATLLSIHHGLIPPTINTSGNENEVCFDLVFEPQSTPITYGISESFGFGGACSSVIFGKWE